MSEPSSRNDVVLKLASGGMGTVFVGRMRGAMGFEQLVAIKRPHRHLLEDPNFRADLLAEATTTARIRHANVVSVRDLEVVGEDVQLVMDYVEGASLAELADAKADLARYRRVLLRVVLDAAAGLHAAHEATDDADRPLGIVHRDVSPANFLVGLDGISRVTDFGIAKCLLRHDDERRTATGVLKGKIGYFAPEYVKDQSLDRRADVFALGVITWEGITGRRLFKVGSELETLQRILQHPVPPLDPSIPGAAELDAILARALAKEPGARFASALELAEALEDVARKHKLLASHSEVAAFVDEIAGPAIRERRQKIRGAKKDDEVTAPIPTGSVESPPPSASAPASAGSTVTATVSAVLEEEPSPPVDEVPTLADPTLPDPPRTNRAAFAAIALVAIAAMGVGAFYLVRPLADTTSAASAPVTVPSTAAVSASQAPVVESAVPVTVPSAPLTAATPPVPSTAVPSALASTHARVPTAGSTRGTAGATSAAPSPSVTPRVNPYPTTTIQRTSPI